MDNYIRNYVVPYRDTYIAHTLEDCKHKLDINRKGFNLFHNTSNVRSINRNIRVDELRLLLDELKVDFQCIILT
nr:unnamed protein product [Callosobruchus analis]